jgi:large conductance mechanosensitive channel
MLKEFKEFALKGSMLELAIALILALFFVAVVTALMNDVLLQIVAALFGKPDFSTLSFTLNGTPIRYGTLITAIINFLLVAFILFLVVRAVNRMNRAEAPAPVRMCPFCTTALSEVATRCPACTSELPAVGSASAPTAT